MDLKLTGKVALVTGSSRGIGLATAKAFAAEGCRVMLSARSAGHLHDAETALRATGAVVAAHAADVGSPDEAGRLIEATAAAYGGIDILVNNVGGGGGGARVADSSDDDWRGVLERKPGPDGPDDAPGLAHTCRAAREPRRLTSRRSRAGRRSSLSNRFQLRPPFRVQSRPL